MNRNRAAYKLLILLIGAVSLAAAVSLYFAQTVGYDLSIQHFAKSSIHAAVALILIIIALSAAIAAGILHAKSGAAARPPLSVVGMFAAACIAFMMLATFIVSIRALSTGLPILNIAQLVLMAFSAAYFFLSAARERKTGGFALVSLCPMLYALVSLLITYFDTSYAMNSPLKSYALLLYISMALFFSAEARAVIKRPLPFLYIFFGGCCLVFTSALGLSQLAIALHDTVGHGFSVLTCALHIAIALYTAVRLFSFTDAPTKEETNGRK